MNSKRVVKDSVCLFLSRFIGMIAVMGAIVCVQIFVGCSSDSAVSVSKIDPPMGLTWGMSLEQVEEVIGDTLDEINFSKTTGIYSCGVIGLKLMKLESQIATFNFLPENDSVKVLVAVGVVLMDSEQVNAMKQLGADISDASVDDLSHKLRKMLRSFDKIYGKRRSDTTIDDTRTVVWKDESLNRLRVSDYGIFADIRFESSSVSRVVDGGRQ